MYVRDTQRQMSIKSVTRAIQDGLSTVVIDSRYNIITTYTIDDGVLSITMNNQGSISTLIDKWKIVLSSYSIETAIHQLCHILEPSVLSILFSYNSHLVYRSTYTKASSTWDICICNMPMGRKRQSYTIIYEYNGKWTILPIHRGDTIYVPIPIYLLYMRRCDMNICKVRPYSYDRVLPLHGHRDRYMSTDL